MPWGMGKKGGMAEEAILAAEVGTGVTITLTVDRDFETETLTSTLLLTADGSESRIIKQFDDSRVAEAKCIQFRVGDAAAADVAWNLDALIARVIQGGKV